MQQTQDSDGMCLHTRCRPVAIPWHSQADGFGQLALPRLEYRQEHPLCDRLPPMQHQLPVSVRPCGRGAALLDLEGTRTKPTESSQIPRGASCLIQKQKLDFLLLP
jgi:hypothetical protein